MKQNISIWQVDRQIYLKMRMLSIGKGLSMANLLEKMVSTYYESDKTLPPSKDKLKKVKRFVRKIKTREVKNGLG